METEIFERVVEADFFLIAITAAAAVVPWAMSIHAKVAVIASAVENLPEVVEELRDVLREHEDRLNAHAKEIEAIKASSRNGG